MSVFSICKFGRHLLCGLGPLLSPEVLRGNLRYLLLIRCENAVRWFLIQYRRRSLDGVRVVIVDGDVVLAAIPSPSQVAGEPTDMPFTPSWRMKGLQTEL